MSVWLAILCRVISYSFPEDFVLKMIDVEGGGAGAQRGCIAEVVNVTGGVTGVVFRGQSIDASSNWRGQIDPVAGGESDPVSM